MKVDQKTHPLHFISDSLNPYSLIHEERQRQDREWGEQNHDDLYWLGILTEEVGELAKAIIEGDCHGAKELVEVAAVAVQWLDAIGRRE